MSPEAGVLSRSPLFSPTPGSYLRKTPSGTKEPRGFQALPWRERHAQVRLTLLVLSAVLLKRDLKGQGERLGGPGPRSTSDGPWPLQLSPAPLPPWSLRVVRASGWAVRSCPAEHRVLGGWAGSKMVELRQRNCRRRAEELRAWGSAGPAWGAPQELQEAPHPPYSAPRSPAQLLKGR